MESGTTKQLVNKENIGVLNTSLEDEQLHNVITPVKTIPLQARDPIDYTSYLRLLSTYAKGLQNIKYFHMKKRNREYIKEEDTIREMTRKRMAMLIIKSNAKVF